MNTPCVLERVLWLRNIEISVTSVSGGNKRVIYCLVFHKSPRNNWFISKWPNTVICLNSIVRKVEPGLGALSLREYNIVVTLQIVRNIVSFGRVYHRVNVVDSEVEVRIGGKQTVYFRLWFAGSARICGIFARWNLNITNELFRRGVAPFDWDSLTKFRTEPVFVMINLWFLNYFRKHAPMFVCALD